MLHSILVFALILTWDVNLSCEGHCLLTAGNTVQTAYEI